MPGGESGQRSWDSTVEQVGGRGSVRNAWCFWKCRPMAAVRTVYCCGPKTRGGKNRWKKSTRLGGVLRFWAENRSKSESKQAHSHLYHDFSGWFL
jgi:hypothetical protein